MPPEVPRECDCTEDCHMMLLPRAIRKHRAKVRKELEERLAQTQAQLSLLQSITIEDEPRTSQTFSVPHEASNSVRSLSPEGSEDSDANVFSHAGDSSSQATAPPSSFQDSVDVDLSQDASQMSLWSVGIDEDLDVAVSSQSRDTPPPIEPAPIANITAQIQQRRRERIEDHVLPDVNRALAEGRLQFVANDDEESDIEDESPDELWKGCQAILAEYLGDRADAELRILSTYLRVLAFGALGVTVLRDHVLTRTS